MILSVWLWTSALVLVNTIEAQNYCTKDADTHGYLYIKYGEPLDLPCSINKDAHLDSLSGNPYFTQDGKELSNENVNSLDSSNIKLHIGKPRRSKSVYACKVGNQEICSNTVVVDVEPFPVLDFNCISYNFNNLTCTWTAPKSYAEINYTLAYHFRDRPIRNPCPKLVSIENGKRLSCSWTNRTLPRYNPIEPEYNFELSINNVFGKTVMQKIWKQNEHVILNPPKDLRYLNKTSESIYLQWSIPSEIQKFPLQHRLMYRPEHGQRSWQVAKIIETGTSGQRQNVYLNLTGLQYGHANYEIHISLRLLTAAYESLWSDYSNITVKTLSKIPTAPPLTNMGSFEIRSLENNKTAIYVYWQGVKNETKNGENFRYLVEAKGRSSVKSIETTNNFAEFKSLNGTESYTLQIWSVNSVGRSEKGSIVYVPMLSQRLEAPIFSIIPYGNEKYEIQATNSMPNNSYHSINSYTIFWCENDKEGVLHQCLGDLLWKEIPGNKTRFNVTIPDIAINQFAISANSKISSSGISWSNCSNFQAKGQGRLKGVWINKVYPTAIELTWTSHCFKELGNTFTAYYCSIPDEYDDCEGKEESVIIPVNSEMNRKNITDLEPEKRYKVNAFVEHGFARSGGLHKELHTYTLEEVPNPPINIRIATIDTSIILAWERPNITSNISIFYVVVCTNGSNITMWNTTTSKQYTITGLESYSEYEVYVKVCTDKACSEPSEPKNVKTRGKSLSAIHWVGSNPLNGSGIILEWEQPEPLQGTNLFEVLFRKDNHGRPVSQYTYDTHFETNCCDENETENSVYVSVRAVRIINDERIEGPWSEEFEIVCAVLLSLWLWSLIPIVLILLITFIYLGRRVYLNYQKEIDLDIILPSGLNSPTDLKNWGRPSIDETALARKFFNENLTDVISNPTYYVNQNDPQLELNNDSLPTEQMQNSSFENTNKNSLSHSPVANAIQYGPALPDHANVIIQNLLEDEKFIQLCKTKSLTGESEDSISKHEDEPLPSLTSLSSEREQLIKDYYNNFLQKENLNASSLPNGYVEVGNHSPKSYVTVGNHLPSGYVTVESDNQHSPISILYEDERLPMIKPLSHNLKSAADSHNNEQYKDFRSPSPWQDNPSQLLPEGYTVLPNILNNDQNKGKNQILNSTDSPQGYVTVSELPTIKKNQIQDLKYLPKGYVQVSSDSGNSLISNLGKDSSSLDNFIPAPNSNILVQTKPCPTGYVTVSELPNSRNNEIQNSKNTSEGYMQACSNNKIEGERCDSAVNLNTSLQLEPSSEGYVTVAELPNSKKYENQNIPEGYVQVSPDNENRSSAISNINSIQNPHTSLQSRSQEGYVTVSELPTSKQNEAHDSKEFPKAYVAVGSDNRGSLISKTDEDKSRAIGTNNLLENKQYPEGYGTSLEYPNSKNNQAQDSKELSKGYVAVGIDNSSSLISNINVDKSRLLQSKHCPNGYKTVLEFPNSKKHQTPDSEDVPSGYMVMDSIVNENRNPSDDTVQSSNMLSQSDHSTDEYVFPNNINSPISNINEKKQAECHANKMNQTKDSKNLPSEYVIVGSNDRNTRFSDLKKENSLSIGNFTPIQSVSDSDNIAGLRGNSYTRLSDLQTLPSVPSSRGYVTLSSKT